MTAYTQQVWVDGVTSADAAHLNYMEGGIADAQQDADAAATLSGTAPSGFCWAVYTSGTPDPPRPTARTDLRCMFIGFPAGSIPTHMLPGDLLLRDNS